MRILLSSHRFHPDVGGIESVSMLLAQAFAKAGHEVVVVTQTAGGHDSAWPFRVERQPRALQLMNLVSEAEIVFHNHLSLQTAWPLLLVWRPWIVTLQTWLPRQGIFARLKRWSLRFARRIYISRAIGADVGLPGEVIGNPYDASVFRSDGGAERVRDVVFVGRLVSDKGADLLLEALALLRNQGVRPSLTVVGGGPDENALKTQTAALSLQGQVRFAGVQSGKALAEILRQHRVLVVPSRWAEPFGIVALEGIACGCVVVASDQGGLPEAVGPCGVTFPNGDARVLAERIKLQIERYPYDPHTGDNQVDSHLKAYTIDAIARRYLTVFCERLHSAPRGKTFSQPPAA